MRKLMLIATLALLVLPSAAAANNAIGVAPGGNVSKTTPAGMPMQIIDSGGMTISCNVTYGEVLVNKINKVAGFQVGSVTGGTAVGCVGGVGMYSVDAVILQLGQMSPKVYQSFAGNLPNITSLLLRIQPLRILIRYKDNLMPPNTIGCLYQGPVGFNTGGAVNTIDRLIIQPNQFVPLNLQLFGMIACPNNIRVTGTFMMNPVQNLILR